MSTTIVDDDVDDEDDDDDDDDDDDVVGGGVMISITYQCLPLLSVWTTLLQPSTPSKAYLFLFLHAVSRSIPSLLKFAGLLSRYSVAVREQNTLFDNFLQSLVINLEINIMKS